MIISVLETQSQRHLPATVTTSTTTANHATVCHFHFRGVEAYRTTRRQTNSRQSSRGQDNSRSGQLADNEFFTIANFISTLNLTLTLTLSNIDSI